MIIETTLTIIEIVIVILMMKEIKKLKLKLKLNKIKEIVEEIQTEEFLKEEIVLKTKTSIIAQHKKEITDYELEQKEAEESYNMYEKLIEFQSDYRSYLYTMPPKYNMFAVFNNLDRYIRFGDNDNNFLSFKKWYESLPE